MRFVNIKRNTTGGISAQKHKQFIPGKNGSARRTKSAVPTHGIETPISHLSLLPAEETLHALLFLVVFHFLHNNACLLASGGVSGMRKDPPLVSSTGQSIGCIEALSPGVA
jgi:hypothetical protein